MNNSNNIKKEILHKDLDKFYTKQEIVVSCVTSFLELLKSLSLDNNYFFIEPSAGAGVFLNILKKREKVVFGFDLHPEAVDIKKNDFLKNNNVLDLISLEDKKYIQKLNPIVIGNPPFGKKAKLAIDFINNSLEIADLVGFILPIQFRKWSAQSKIINSAGLILDIDIPENAFSFMGKDYNVRCCFQVWVNKSIIENNKGNIANLRLIDKPATVHEDFLLYQYNRTKEAEKYFDYEWDFAVPRQGYLDYDLKIYDKSSCNRKSQWIFFKAKDDKVLEKLHKIDFKALSKKNIGIPGFGKADVIKAYQELI